MKSLASKYIIANVLLFTIGGIVTVLLQHFCGNFPVEIFRFPLNLIIMVVWLYILMELYKAREYNIVTRYLLSNEATWMSIMLLILACIAMGLQRHPATTSYPFVLAIFYTLTQLTLVIMRGWRNSEGVRWRFLCNHVGLWLAVGAGFWGSPDMDVLRTIVDTEQPTQVAYRMDGSASTLKYNLQLMDFRAEYYENNTPSSYEADIMIDGQRVTLSVNHPHAHSFIEDIYLTAYDYNSNGVYCIIQIVKQPAKWVMAIGIIMLIAGAIMMFVQGYKPKVS